MYEIIVQNLGQPAQVMRVKAVSAQQARYIASSLYDFVHSCIFKE